MTTKNKQFAICGLYMSWMSLTFFWCHWFKLLVKQFCGWVIIIPCMPYIHGWSSVNFKYFWEDVMDIKDLITPFIHVCQYKNRNFYAWTKMIITLFLCLTICLQTHVRCEVYSSASDMKNIFRMEMDLASSLNNYASKTQAKLDRIDKYIQVCRIIS